MESVIDWLSHQTPWVRYRTKIDLLGNSLDEKGVKQDFNELINHPQIKVLLQELQEWPGATMKRHNDAKLLYHKLVFLADLGITIEHPLIAKVAKKILESQSQDGPFKIIGNIPTVFGGNGIDEAMWMLCDAPLITYALAKMGLAYDARVKESVQYLTSLIQDFGWPCAATSTLGAKFKGPGKRIDPCPYANLIMLKLLSAIPSMKNGTEAMKGVSTLLDLWEFRKEKKYFLFGMGTDFCKLKAPFIWFDILHVADVLTKFEFARKDNRLVEMLKIIQSKADGNGFYKAESVYRAWKDWDFGQKKEASAWITFLVYRILKNFYDEE